MNIIKHFPQPGTTRGTGLEAPESARFLDMHRITPIEPWELPTITRQMADERAASQHYADSQASSAEGCADTSDGEWDKPPMTPMSALILAGVMALSALLSIGVMALVWGIL